MGESSSLSEHVLKLLPFMLPNHEILIDQSVDLINQHLPTILRKAKLPQVLPSLLFALLRLAASHQL